MKLKFVPKGTPHSINIQGEKVNGFDLSSFPEGAKFLGNSDSLTAGVFDVQRINGELYVKVGQQELSYDCTPLGGSHDWGESDDWIDDADYDPDRCYIVATSAPEGAEYVKRDSGWTVVVPQPQGEPTP